MAAGMVTRRRPAVAQGGGAPGVPHVLVADVPRTLARRGANSKRDAVLGVGTRSTATAAPPAG